MRRARLDIASKACVCFDAGNGGRALVTPGLVDHHGRGALQIDRIEAQEADQEVLEVIGDLNRHRAAGVVVVRGGPRHVDGGISSAWFCTKSVIVWVVATVALFEPRTAA